MKIFQKTKDGSQPQTRIEKRVSTIGTTDLVIWAENSLSSIGKNIAGLGPKTYESYAEAELGAEALLAIVRELKKRIG
ncbi:hypothetical protein UFOVP45_13 [uncultured Caudovirales phage]|uniref:Uncharacterized protein n=1 Tax=uncultured Caudovirales phage TaxID=2100421 RepID=A0A6J5KN26_9CAUD|nr:hypothetical protein UFOVP45_13 [uncultured Caudovirales phage]